MGWYERALEYEKEVLSRPQPNLKEQVRYTYYEDGVRVKEISIFSRFVGELPDLSIYPDLEILNIYTEITWEYITSFNFKKLKKLDIRIKKDSKQIPLNIVSLEELVVYMNDGYEALTPLEKMLVETEKYDFSSLPNLETLKLSRWNTLDYVSLNSLKKLKYLWILDSHTTNLEWIRKISLLSEFTCDAKLSNVEGIECQYELKKLCLSHNEITDITPILALKKLQHLDLRKNPLSNSDGITEKGIPSIIITEKDYEIREIEKTVDRLYQWPIEQICRENKRLKESPESISDYLRRRLSRPYFERLQEYIQQSFEDTLRGINPFSSGCTCYSMEYKSLFIKRALEEYPFLKLSKEMAKRIIAEGHREISFEVNEPGTITYLGEDIYFIKTEAKHGNGNIQIFSEKDISTESIIKKLVYERWEELLPEHNFASYDVSITVRNVYGKKTIEEDITLAILIALRNFFSGKVFPEKTLLFAKYHSKKGLAKDELYNKHKKIIAMNGFHTVVTYGKDLSHMPQKDEYCRYLYYNNKEDLLRHCMRDIEPAALKPRNHFEQVLLDIFYAYPQVIREANIFKALNKDLLFDFKKEVYVLNLLAETNILSDIERAAFVDAKLAYRYEYKMCEDFGIDQTLAHQIVNSLCYCFGGCYLNKNLQDWT